MAEKLSSFQGDVLLQAGYEVVTDEQREREALVLAAIMSEREERWKAEEEQRKAAPYVPVPVEILTFNADGYEIPSPEHVDWLHRQADREEARRNRQTPKQTKLVLWERELPTGSRDQA